MASAADNVDAATAFLREAAQYFSKRPTHGEDSAWWANYANARNCVEIAKMIEDMDRQLHNKEA